VLRPHHRAHAELDEVGHAADGVAEEAELLGGEPVLQRLRFGDRRQVGRHSPGGTDAAGVGSPSVRVARTERKRLAPSTPPQQRFAGMLGVRHQSEDVAPRVDDAGDVAQRAVRVRCLGGAAGGIDVAEDDLSVVLELLQGLGVGDVAAFPVLDRQREDVGGRAAAGEGCIGFFAPGSARSGRRS
jgi:hypothetical protein